MASKKLVVPLSIIVLFCFSSTCIAGGLHFGIIDAIDDRIDDLKDKVVEKKVKLVEATTGSNGESTIHDDKHDVEVTVSIEDETTGEGIEGVEFEYIHTGDYVICVTKNDPNHAYFSGISVSPASQVGAAASTETVRSQTFLALPIIIKLVSCALTGYSVYKLVNDPPHIDVIYRYPFVEEWVITDELDDLIDEIAQVAVLFFGGEYFAIAHAVAPTALKLGLERVAGIDVHKKYKLTGYRVVGIYNPPFFVKLEPIASITVTSPNGGESWQRGTSHTITWTSSGSVGSSVGIRLFKGGSLDHEITSSTPNDGSYSWYISLSQTVGSDYRIYIYSISDTSIHDVSNSAFSITDP